MIAFNNIHNVKYIVIIVDNKSFANANALYSYVLSKHKKVTLVKIEEIDIKFSFLPWYEKVRDNVPSSADLIIDSMKIMINTVEVFNFLKNDDIKLNQKMATSLYAGLLQEYDGLTGDKCNSTTFVIASELIELNAEYKKCNDFLLKRDSLALFRLKAVMYKKMILSSDAKVLKMYITDNDLKETGATLKDINQILKEGLKMVHVKKVILYKSDEKNKILKSIKEI